MNKIIIKGRLTKNPELKTTDSGISFCNVDVAVDRSYHKDGEEKQCDFFQCTFWRKGAEFIVKYFTKGQEILIDGEMQSRKYQDKEGNNRTAWSIENCHAEFCGGKKDNNSSTSEAVTGTVEPTNNDYQMLEDDDEQLPF